jgi:hypothetical protein
MCPGVCVCADKVTTRNPKVLEKLGFAHLITPDMMPSGSGVLSPVGGRIQQLEARNRGEWHADMPIGVSGQRPECWSARVCRA